MSAHVSALGAARGAHTAHVFVSVPKTQKGGTAHPCLAPGGVGMVHEVFWGSQPTYSQHSPGCGSSPHLCSLRLCRENTTALHVNCGELVYDV